MQMQIGMCLDKNTPFKISPPRHIYSTILPFFLERASAGDTFQVLCEILCLLNSLPIFIFSVSFLSPSIALMELYNTNFNRLLLFLGIHGHRGQSSLKFAMPKGLSSVYLLV